jgi:FAD/FMN-containing dehydrogenase
LLLVGFEGSTRETEWQAASWQKEVEVRHPKQQTVVQGAEAERLWRALSEFAVGTDNEIAFQTSLLPSKVAAFEAKALRLGVATLAHSGDGIVIGKLSRSATGAASEVELCASLELGVQQSGGSFVPLGGAAGRGPVPANSAGARTLMRKLKQSFDPADLLNPGRMFSQDESKKA